MNIKEKVFVAALAGAEHANLDDGEERYEIEGITHTAGTEAVLRLKNRRDGAPRYLKLKISEMI